MPKSKPHCSGGSANCQASGFKKFPLLQVLKHDIEIGNGLGSPKISYNLKALYQAPNWQSNTKWSSVSEYHNCKKYHNLYVFYNVSKSSTRICTRVDILLQPCIARERKINPAVVLASVAKRSNAPAREMLVHPGFDSLAGGEFFYSTIIIKIFC